MTEEPSHRSDSPDAVTGIATTRILILLALINIAVKAPLYFLNQGEYTDGILQLQVFERKSGLYPPLYGSLAALLHLAGFGLEPAGKIISIVASSLTVIPVFLIARHVSGIRAAAYAAALFTIAPLALRWAPRVMTDSLFLLLSTMSLYLMQKSWSQANSEIKRAAATLQLAGIAAAFAALTRYQGVFLMLPWLLVPVSRIRRFTAAPVIGFFHIGSWAAFAGWLFSNGFAHGGQIAERTAGSLQSTLLAYWNSFESFVLTAPYYFTYTAFALAVLGLGEIIRNRNTAFSAVWGVWAITILALQSVFGSFQYRYMLPLLPLIVVAAGVGGAKLQDVLGRGRSTLFAWGLGFVFLHQAVFAGAVLLLQRQSFGDQRAAAQFIKSYFRPEDTIFANEQYGAFSDLECVKLSFWSGRPVRSVWKQQKGRGIPALTDFPPGCVVLLSNAYGGNEQVQGILSQLQARYKVRQLTIFPAQIYPLMDDIMVSASTNQNPLAWVLRYTRQSFVTSAILVEGMR